MAKEIEPQQMTLEEFRKWWVTLDADARIEWWPHLTREQRLNEPGDQPPCPLCGTPRVLRSTYIRCNRDGVNWGMDEDWSRHPNNPAPDARSAKEKSDSAA